MSGLASGEMPGCGSARSVGARWCPLRTKIYVIASGRCIEFEMTNNSCITMCDTSALLVLGSVCFANIYLDFKNDL